MQEEIRDAITHKFSGGITISNMRNYYFGMTGTYYFAGMYTAVLPMIPGIYSVVRLLRTDRKLRQLSERLSCSRRLPAESNLEVPAIGGKPKPRPLARSRN